MLDISGDGTVASQEVVSAVDNEYNRQMTHALLPLSKNLKDESEYKQKLSAMADQIKVSNQHMMEAVKGLGLGLQVSLTKAIVEGFKQTQNSTPRPSRQ